MVDELKSALFLVVLFGAFYLIVVELPERAKQHANARFGVPAQIDLIRDEFRLELDRLDLLVLKANVSRAKSYNYWTKRSKVEQTVEKELDLIEREWFVEMKRLRMSR